MAYHACAGFGIVGDVRWLAPILLTACFSPTAPVGVPCGPDLSCPEGQTCDILSNQCGAQSEALFWRDDTAAEFAAPGASTADVTIERQGFVAPATHLTGGVRLHGYDGLLTTLTSDALVADHAATGAGVQHSLRIHFGTSNPPGLGIANPDNATVLVEGEIELEVAGAWRFELTANDRGYLEIAAPGTTAFERVVEDEDTGTIGTYTAAQAGWHPFRIAFQDALMSLDLDLVYDPPNINGNAFRDIPTDRIRTRVDDLPDGLIVDGFEHTNLIQLEGTLLDATRLDMLTLDTNPFGLLVGGGYSLRWTGQFLVDDPADFTFEIGSPNGHRLWIDGVALADELASGQTSSVTAPVALAAGWHDLVLDANKSGLAGTLSLTVGGTSQFAGGAIPPDHLRPVAGRRARFFADQALTVVSLPDGTGASGTRSLTLDPPASLVTPLDLTGAVQVAGDSLPTVSLVLDPPAGANIQLAAVGALTGTSAFIPFPLTLGNFGSSFLFIGTDTVADMLVDQITAAFITLIYDGGIPPIALASTYESAVRELGDTVGFERIAWVSRGDPDAVRVSLRTCDSEAACASEPYVEVTNDSEPAVTPRRFAQYKVELTSDGEATPALDTIELRYFVSSP